MSAPVVLTVSFGADDLSVMGRSETKGHPSLCGQIRSCVDPLWFPRKQAYSDRDLGPVARALTYAYGTGACSFSGESDAGLDDVDTCAETDKGDQADNLLA